jgi:hypothetical protein
LEFLEGGYHASEWHVLIFADRKKRWHFFSENAQIWEELEGLNYLLQGGVTMLRNEGLP